MKALIAGASALALALAVAAPASAETSFRAPAAQTFSQSDLQSYGLNAQAAQRGVDLQRQGYQIQVLSEDQARNYRAGITDTQWILLGILAGVVVIAVAAD